ncbi:MAG: hypothetical protein JSS83_23855 [Cyanobacteria bacterium SZAS LIN-3]|nr:hypothetical protein [Cyanobacteria bacterium SZAS LIN-3]
MRFIRGYYFLLYPVLGALVGAYLGYQMDDIETGCIDGLVLGSLAAIWYWIRRAGRYGLRL